MENPGSSTGTPGSVMVDKHIAVIAEPGPNQALPMAEIKKEPSNPGNWATSDYEAAFNKALDRMKEFEGKEYQEHYNTLRRFRDEHGLGNYCLAFLTGDMTAEEYTQVDASRRWLNTWWKAVRREYDACMLAWDGDDFFKADGKWLRAGTAYRLLVEPIDIANWYKCGIHVYDSVKGPGHHNGHYADATDKRPSQYFRLQQLQERGKREVDISLAWAYEFKRLALLHNLPTIQSVADAKDGKGFKKHSTEGVAAGTAKTPNPGFWKHEVFISHTGAEKDLAHSIYMALQDRLGFRAFFDEISLQSAMGIDKIMDAAAEDSPVAVVILSPAFFTRKWPLRELAIIMKGSRILPVWVGEAVHELERELGSKPDKSELLDEEWEQLKKDLLYTTIIVKKDKSTGELLDEICYGAVQRCYKLCEYFGSKKEFDTAALQRFRTRVLDAVDKIEQGKLSTLRLYDWHKVKAWGEALRFLNRDP